MEAVGVGGMMGWGGEGLGEGRGGLRQMGKKWGGGGGWGVEVAV